MNPHQEKEFADMKLKVNDIHKAIIGDPDLGQKGIVPRVISLEVHQKKNEAFKDKIAGGVALGTVVGGGLWAWFLKHFG
jgi:hypothetical protein